MKCENCAVLSFTEKGAKLNQEICVKLSAPDVKIKGYGFYKYPCEGLTCFQELQPLVKELFFSCNLLVFIGAAGIAVRAIAPYLTDKTTDPAVLAIDENAKFVISLLSGHLGGANDWCRRISALLLAQAVITTATDGNHVFAVDEFAKNNHLYLPDMKMAKEASARLLNGESIGFCSEFGIYVGNRTTGSPFSAACYLLPKNLTVGIGCKRGKTKEEIHAFLCSVFQAHDLRIERIEQLTSIDLKKTESGIVQEAAALDVPYRTFGAGELQALAGAFLESSFVEKTVGTGNVCERSAVLGAAYGKMEERKQVRLLIGKQVKDGMTIAVAERTIREFLF
ncbi:MAG TPA: cobalt-precorrin 5A hydrolase [Lachnospiraceae bacterium]|nr:cobalt-precorrin 5A hydrolase [Lachnospiraceae bacterium]